MFRRVSFIAKRSNPLLLRQCKSRPMHTGAPPATLGLDSTQAELYNMAQAFAEAEMEPHVAEWDEKEIFPLEVLKKAAALGFGGIYVDESQGGSSLSRHDASLVFEALSTSDVSTTAFLSIHNMV